MKNRTCKKCKIKQNIEDFYKEKLGADGHKTICKTCTKELVIINRKGNISYAQQASDYYKGYRNRNPFNEVLRNIKQRSRKENIPFDLTMDDIIIPEICPILEVPMVKGTDYAPSVDRIIPSLGYTKGNIMIISKKANTMKSNATIEELKTFCQNALAIYSIK